MTVIDRTGSHHDQAGKFTVQPLSETSPDSLARAAAPEDTAPAITKTQQVGLDALDQHGHIAADGSGRYATVGLKPSWIQSKITVNRLEELGLIRHEPKKNADGTVSYNRFVRA